MRKIENKKILIIGTIIFIIIIVIIKFTDIYIGKKDTSTDELVNLIETSEKSEEQEEKIIIYITGEVINEGVYELKEGSRIANAIEAAGGTKETANLKNVNLAYELEDGEKIYIPNINEEAEEIIQDENTGIINEENKEAIININKADTEELQELSGIGESTAKSIIKYREENGKFNTIEDIMNVPGIGESKFENIKEQIKVK